MGIDEAGTFSVGCGGGGAAEAGGGCGEAQCDSVHLDISLSDATSAAAAVAPASAAAAAASAAAVRAINIGAPTGPALVPAAEPCAAAHCRGGEPWRAIVLDCSRMADIDGTACRLVRRWGGR